MIRTTVVITDNESSEEVATYSVVVKSLPQLLRVIRKSIKPITKEVMKISKQIDPLDLPL